MKNFGYVIPTICCLWMMAGCGNQHDDKDHAGEKKLDLRISQLDTIQFEDDNLGSMYCLLMNDSSVVFADMIQHNLSFYDPDSGKLIDRRLGHGNGPKELSSLMYAQTLKNSNDEILIVNNSLGLYIYYPKADSLEYKGRIDFNWGNGNNGDYSDVCNYKLMEVTDYSMNFVKEDSSILVPVSLINRNFENIDSRRYEEGRIFGRLNPSTMKVEDISGEFPAAYKETPNLFFEFFDFDVDTQDKKLYYSFAIDSLIYVKDMKTNAIKNFGFEPHGINRDYTPGYDLNFDSFRDDIKKVGVNTGLYIDQENKLIFRTSLISIPSEEVVMQVYDFDGNLRLEESMPTHFKLLGQRDGEYYGARLHPIEDGETVIFQIYSFSIEPK